MNKLLLEVNFRLRNTEEYNKIKEKFIENGFETIVIENINNREFEIELLNNYINKNKLREKYEKIVVISNIEDALFVWHRIYNFLADDFIFFIDKYNYSLLKGKIYEELSNMNAVEKESIDSIYINFNSQTIEKLENKLKNPENIKFIREITDIEYNKNKLKELIYKRYIYENEVIENSIESKNRKIIKIEKKERNINSIELFEIFDKNIKCAIYFIIMNYKLSLNNIEKTRKLSMIFKNYFENSSRSKKVLEYLKKEDSGLEMFWKIQICSLAVFAGNKGYEFLEEYMKALIKYNGKEKYSFLINAFFYNYMEKVESYLEFNKDVVRVIKDIADEFTKSIVIEKKATKKNKIAIIVDQIMGKRHSTAKAILDYAININKYICDSEVKIFIEDNFRQNEEESISIHQYNSDISRKLTAEHRMYLQEYKCEDKIEIYYSNTKMDKKERVIELINEVAEFNPEIILNMNNAYSLSMECLSKHYKSYYLTMGLVNWQDNQIYNFYSKVIDKNILPEFKNIIFLNTRAVNFEKKQGIYNREQFGIKEDEYVMISVSLLPEIDFEQEYLSTLIEILEKYKKCRLILVGTDFIPNLKNEYKEISEKKIILIKYEKNLGDLYNLCNVYINPKRDGGGYSIAEAMTYGLPVVNISGCEAGDSWIGKENSVADYNEYKEKIIKLIENKEYNSEQGEIMKQRIEEAGFKKHIEEIFDYFNKI